MSEIKFNEDDNKTVDVNVESTAQEEFDKKAGEVKERVRHLSEKSAGSQLPVKYRPVINDYMPSFAEMRLPRVNIVQCIGDLKDSFDPGEIVYRQTTVLYSPERRGEKATDPCELVILGLLPKRWAERKSGGERGRLLDSEDAIRKAGGTVDYDEWKLKKDSGLAYFEPLAEFIVLLKQPKHLPNSDSIFPFYVDGARYALAIWGMKGSAYNNCAKFVFADRQIGPTYEKGYPSCLYRCHAWVKSFGPGKSAWIPKFEAVGPTSESFQAFAAEIIAGASGAGANDAGAAEE